MIDTIRTRLSSYPLATTADARRPQISDGFHSRADFEAGRAKRVHRGADLTWPRNRAETHASKQQFPFGTKGFLAPLNRYERPVLAIASGQVVHVAAEWSEYGKTTGGAVILDHGLVQVDGRQRRLFSGYHHLEVVCAGSGLLVSPGAVLGTMGGSPPADRLARAATPFAGLVHLHLDLFLGADDGPLRLTPGKPPQGQYLDPAPYIAGLPVPRLADVWGATVSVGAAEEPDVA